MELEASFLEVGPLDLAISLVDNEDAFPVRDNHG